MRGWDFANSPMPGRLRPDEKPLRMGMEHLLALREKNHASIPPVGSNERRPRTHKACKDNFLGKNHPSPRWLSVVILLLFITSLSAPASAQPRRAKGGSKGKSSSAPKDLEDKDGEDKTASEKELPPIEIKPMSEERRRRVEDLSGENVIGLETDHFLLYYSIGRVKVGSRAYDTKSGAKLYAARLEEAYRHCYELLLPAPGGSWRVRKHEIILLDTLSGYSNTARKLTGQAGSFGAYRYGDVSLFATFSRGNREIRSDHQLHEKVVHHVAHLLIQDYGLLNLDFPSWVSVGFAHLVENRIFRSNLFFCFTELPRPDSWKRGSWKKLIRKDLAKGKELSIADLMARPIDAMNYRDMAYAMSFVDFLIATDKKKFSYFVQQLKRNPDTKAALKSVYGWILGEMELEWKKHVPRSKVN